MPEEEIGVITHYYNHLEVGIIKLSAPLKKGDTIRVKGAHDDFTQTVESMQIREDKIDEGKPGDEVGVKVSQKVHEHDKVFKVT